MSDVLDLLRQSLAPHYDIERQIGAGGMARVYLAIEQHPHRRVAIKVIDPELSNGLLRERFIREVDLSSKLSHPHIVPIFSAGEAGGLFYAVLGERDAAVALMQEAFAQGYGRGGVMHLYPSLMALRGYAPFRELMRSKE